VEPSSLAFESLLTFSSTRRQIVKHLASALKVAAGRLVLFVCMVASGLAGAVTLVSARDESGMYEMLLGRAPAHQPRAPPRALQGRFYVLPVEEQFRPRKARPRASPRVAKRPPPVVASPGSVPSASGWLAVILQDETLRRGDVVVFPKGPKVFAGEGAAPPWSEADFEDVSGSRMMSRKSRKILLAMTGRIANENEGEDPKLTQPGRKPRALVGVKPTGLAARSD
jgi:hypothetical protein